MNTVANVRPGRTLPEPVGFMGEWEKNIKKIENMAFSPCAFAHITSKVRAAMSEPIAQPLVEVEGLWLKRSMEPLPST